MSLQTIPRFFSDHLCKRRFDSEEARMQHLAKVAQRLLERQITRTATSLLKFDSVGLKIHVRLMSCQEARDRKILRELEKAKNLTTGKVHHRMFLMNFENTLV